MISTLRGMTPLETLAQGVVIGYRTFCPVTGKCIQCEKLVSYCDDYDIAKRMGIPHGLKYALETHRTVAESGFTMYAARYRTADERGKTSWLVIPDRVHDDAKYKP